MLKLVHLRKKVSGSLLCCALFAGVSSVFAFPEPEDPQFSPVRWKGAQISSDGRNKFFSRENEFWKFLRDYDLVGMKRRDVRQLLGDEDRKNGYLLMQGPCNQVDVKIIYEDDRVKKWRLEDGRDPVGPLLEHWHTTNVIWTQKGFESKSSL